MLAPAYGSEGLYAGPAFAHQPCIVNSSMFRESLPYGTFMATFEALDHISPDLASDVFHVYNLLDSLRLHVSSNGVCELEDLLDVSADRWYFYKYIDSDCESDV